MIMTVKPFQTARRFPQLDQRFLSEFRRAHYVCEIAAGITVEDLLNPMNWEPQPRLKRPDIIECISVDNRLHVTLLVEDMLGGHPIVRPISISQAAPPNVESTSPNRVEYQPARQWTVIFGDQPVASGFADRASAEAELADRLGGEAA
jgi:hypothetical protein